METELQATDASPDHTLPAPTAFSTAEVSGELVTLFGERYYCIRNYDQMPPFFMSIASNSDHWLFISSTGGLSAGRVNAESALFPYYTEDKISESSELTGNKALFLVGAERRNLLWEPFSQRYEGMYTLERNLYKHINGNRLVFEEINYDLGLRYRYAWQTSQQFGFVKSSWLANLGGAAREISLLDGLQNILPYGATVLVQNNMSNLLDAYKRNELEPQSGLGMFTLNATLTDRAEPSEALKATTIWQVGLDQPLHLLSSTQLARFRRRQPLSQETELRGLRGAYFVHTTLELDGGDEQSWHLVAELNQDSCAITETIAALNGSREALAARLLADIERGADELVAIMASVDGLQLSADEPSTVHHFANVLFNTMRGGVFVDGYRLEKRDLLDFIATRNHAVYAVQSAFFEALPATLTVGDLLDQAAASGSPDLERLCYGYLPLTFSRRHGDPSRPWNRFAIQVRRPDGSKRVDYEGNWRDIFQNWEALAYSYPEFVESMICTFLNATTADGYNPYRVNRRGIEWEIPEPENPWSNIGYWSDHQIIYLQKLMETSAIFHPGKLQSLLNRRIFSHANVPYRIKPYETFQDDPSNTIVFDYELDRAIEQLVEQRGSDGKLLLAPDGSIFAVTLLEKLLTLLLAKISNLVPEGGIWMNTQRPEWNDANNALVGKGMSVVTVAYLRRFIAFCSSLIASSSQSELTLTAEVKGFFDTLSAVLQRHRPALACRLDDRLRRTLMDELGQAGSNYRWSYYRQGLSGELAVQDKGELLSFLALAQEYVEHTLRANEREDQLYHAYNLLELGQGEARVGYLYEMLEGQVAILSSGLLSGSQALALLCSMRHSALYRADQHSYMLYPNREVQSFLRKNCLSQPQVAPSALIAALIERHDRNLITRDLNGVYHFSGDFKNAGDVRRALATLSQQPEYATLVEAESALILELFEQTFTHRMFTGRSSTFFGYEGLGSIYWHMVSKLLLAAQEAALAAIKAQEDPQTIDGLIAAYYDIRQGLSFNKTPATYGAFPTDPYSHTPAGQGARQPGMTGQVKEEILARWAELGLRVEQGALYFTPALLRTSEYLERPGQLHAIDVAGSPQLVAVPAGALAYTFCQVPIVCSAAAQPSIEVILVDGSQRIVPGPRLDAELSQHIFLRDGFVRQLNVRLAAFAS